MLLSKFEIALGALLIFLACGLVYQAKEDPHGLVFFSALQIGTYGAVTVLCGFMLLTNSGKLKLASQFLLVIASAFILIEFFTSYSGWWL